MFKVIAINPEGEVFVQETETRRRAGKIAAIWGFTAATGLNMRSPVCIVNVEAKALAWHSMRELHEEAVVAFRISGLQVSYLCPDCLLEYRIGPREVITPMFDLPSSLSGGGLKVSCPGCGRELPLPEAEA